MLEEIGFDFHKPTVFLKDNDAVMKMETSIGVSEANKHFNVKLHWVFNVFRMGKPIWIH